MNVIAQYIKESPINLSALEKKAGLAPQTLHNYYNKTGRVLRPPKWWSVLRALCPVVIGDNLYTYDPTDDTFTSYCFSSAPAKKTVEKDGIFTYYPAVHISLIDALAEFIYWFGLKEQDNKGE